MKFNGKCHLGGVLGVLSHQNWPQGGPRGGQRGAKGPQGGPKEPPRMLELSAVVPPLLEVGGRGASQGRFWSDFGLILGSLSEHFWIQFGS